MSWLQQEPVRVVQFLLRNVDAAVESPERLAEVAASWGASAMLINAAGFSAWYPTELAYQRGNDDLRSDFFGIALERAHSLGLAAIARIDVSKTLRSVAAEHPEWLRRGMDGAPVSEWEMAETCFTGEYWQSCNFDIVAELLHTYAVDGLFYNMFRIPHCFCSRCQDTVRAFGLAGVPQSADPSDAAWRTYDLWRRATLAEYTERLRDFIHQRRPEAALMVYHHQKEGWDQVRMARASDLISVTASSPLGVNPLSPQPAWVGWPSYEAALARGLRADRPGVVVTTTSAIFASRRAAQPPERVQASMLQVAFQRGAVCPAIPGGLEQEDARALPAVAATLTWLAEHADLLQSLESAARIALLASRDTLDLCPRAGEGEQSRLEERGMYLALGQLRYPFDVVPLGAAAIDMSRYAVAFLPDIACLSNAAAASLDAWVAQGGVLVASGLVGQFDEQGGARPRSVLRCLGEPRLTGVRSSSGGYLQVRDATLRDALGGTSILGVDGDFLEMDYAIRPTLTDLGLLGPQRNNTPEFATVPHGPSIPGLLRFDVGQGSAWHLPWRPGVLVSQLGLTDVATLAAWLVGQVVGAPPLEIEASSAVETHLWRQPAQQRYVLFLLNVAAQQTTPLTRITPLGPLELRVRLPAKHARAVVAACELPLTYEGQVIRFTLQALRSFEALEISLMDAAHKPPCALL